MSAAVHSRTPVLHAVDPRGLVLRQVDYCRRAAPDVAETRVQRQRIDAAGHVSARWDARLGSLAGAGGVANQVSRHALGGRELSRDSVDGGFACSLFGEAGQVVRSDDGQGNRHEWQYDALLRPLALFEQADQQPRGCSERFEYAGADPELAASNGCGRLWRHDDPAGTLDYPAYALGGQVASQSRRFLHSDDWPDWPEALAGRDALLEPEAAPSHWRHGPLGEVREQCDAAGNRQFNGHTLAGQLRDVRLQQAGQAQPQLLVSALRYNAFGQLEEETLGNGVRVRREHRPQDGRLVRLLSQRADGEYLQDLHYAFEPAGNVLVIDDQARPVRYFANQRIDASGSYGYDSLGQLIEASGWEAGSASRGPGSESDPQAVANYRQTFHYDAGGNLLRLVHVGAQAHGRELAAAAGSNRCLALSGTQPPTEEDFLAAFDRNGNLLRLQAGQALHWDLRNQLRQVSPVQRDSGGDDHARHVYDSGGQRVRTRHVRRVAGRSVTDEVRYLPGLERHSRGASGERFEVLQVQAGTCSIRVLHWQAERPGEVPQDQCRYALGDHLGSCSVELDAAAGLISREHYYPFGETAWRAARNEVEASYRVLRHSGKPRDISGLYYYGARYYRADWQRWLNPDPSGDSDGLNLYRMVGNSPVNRRDADGRQGFDVLDDKETEWVDDGFDVLALGLERFPRGERAAATDALNLGRSLLKNAMKALHKTPGSRMRRALDSTFGITDLSKKGGNHTLLSDLHDTYDQLNGYLKRLQGSESWRLVLVNFNNDGEAAGLTTTAERRGVRIALDAERLKESVLDSAVTLLHEGLHAMTAPLENDHPLDVVTDFWYSLGPTSEFDSREEFDEVMHRVSRDIVDAGPDEQEMSEDDRLAYHHLMRREAAAQGLSKPRNAEERQHYFSSNAAIRRAVAMRNADSLAGFALMLDRR